MYINCIVEINTYIAFITKCPQYLLSCPLLFYGTRALLVAQSCPQYLPQIQRKTILLVLVSMIHCSTLQVLISSILVMVLPLCPLPLSLTKPTISPGLILSVWPSSPNTKWHSSLAQSWSLQSNNLFTLVGRDATLSSCPGF